MTSAEHQSFSPRLFFADSQTRDNTSASTILALGGDDFTLSIWQNTHHKPLVVFTDLFSREILDLGWYVYFHPRKESHLTDQTRQRLTSQV